jgi:hypothetical protein
MSRMSAAKQICDSASTEIIWEQFASQLLTTYAAAPDTEKSMAEILRPATHQLYNSVVDDNHFRDQFLQCPDSAGCGKPTWSATLYESDNIRAGLLSVYRDKPIPFHDHPGAIGVTLVLSGVARIEYANIVGDAHNKSLVELQLTRARERLPGQVCWFFEHDRNIHSVEAKTPNAVLLVIHVPHVELINQSLYFPVAEYQREEGETFMAHRVKPARGQSDSEHV